MLISDISSEENKADKAKYLGMKQQHVNGSDVCNLLQKVAECNLNTNNYLSKQS